jgi:outer membrane receptor protein involved in Fe transport
LTAPAPRPWAGRAGRTGLWSRAAALIILVALSLGLAGQAAADGRLRGRVTDKETGQPLAGVNVVVKGTYRGGATDLDGAYIVGQLKPGTVDLEFSMLGYKTVLVTGVLVLDNQALQQDIALEKSFLKGEDIVIIGKKPLYQVDNTSSSTTLDLESIQTKVVENIVDVVSQQAGVTKSDNEVHIRGGRADENLYIIDGLSVKDPVSGQGTGVFLSASAVKQVEVITGGFNAEYGEAMSGVINVETREGDDELFGSVSWKRDNLGAWPRLNQNQDVVEASVGGPLPNIGLPGALTWFLNGYGSFGDTHLPHATELQPSQDWMEPYTLRQENNASLLAKLTWRPKPTRKLTASWGRSMQVNQGYFTTLVEDRRFYPYEYQRNLDNYNTFSQESRQTSFNWKETLSERSYVDFTYGMFFINQHADAGKHWTQYDRPLDIEPTWYLLNPDGSITIYQGDGFWDYGDTDFWHDHHALTHSLKGAITRSAGAHELKSGFEVENTELQLLHITAPWLATAEAPGRSFDMYRAWTVAGAFYVQDKISYKGMNANLGLRLDYWRPGSYVERVVEDPATAILTEDARALFRDETFGLFGGRWKAQLSPRLGISHPVTDNDMLFFSYGHFSQRPKYAYVYAKLQTAGQGSYQLFGNPNLSPTTTVAYELGLKHKFNSNSVLQLTAFYKDMFNYVTAFNVNSKHPRYGNISYTQYWNIDYARSRGLELSWRHRFERWWSFNWNLSYSVLTGKSSSPAENLLNEVRVGSRDEDLSESFLRWDKPLQTSFDLGYHVARGKAPSIGSWRLPDRWGANLRLELESGQRYTPQYIDMGDPANPDDDEPRDRESKPYTHMTPMQHTVDFKGWKDWRAGALDLRFFCEVENIFNVKSAASSGWINPLTGEVWEEGDPFIANRRVYYEWSSELSRDRVRPPGTPARFKEPRQVMFGVAVQF